MKLLKGFKNQITKFLAKQVVSNTKDKLCTICIRS
jgi:hypothetical protein